MSDRRNRVAVPRDRTLLYTSTFETFTNPTAPGGAHNGSAVNFSTALGVVGDELQAYRATVTGIVAPIITGGRAACTTSR